MLERYGGYQERLGKPFRHAACLDELTSLRDQPKVALSGTPAEGDPTLAELAEQIESLWTSHQIETAPVRARKAEVRKPAPAVPQVEIHAPQSTPPVEAGLAEETEAEPVLTFRQRASRGGQLALF